MEEEEEEEGGRKGGLMVLDCKCYFREHSCRYLCSTLQHLATL